MSPCEFIKPWTIVTVAPSAARTVLVVSGVPRQSRKISRAFRSVFVNLTGIAIRVGLHFVCFSEGVVNDLFDTFVPQFCCAYDAQRSVLD